jgi:formate dehydrogenase subunit beta
MIETALNVQDSTLKTIQGVLRDLLQQGAVDALLVPMALPTHTNVVPTLVREPERLVDADPLAPVMPINAARAVSNLTKTGHRERLGAVLRSCELRAVVELVKLQQVDPDRLVLIGLDCLGTYSLPDYAALVEAGVDPSAGLLAAAPEAAMTPAEGYAFRPACQMCEFPTPEGDHVPLVVGLLGLEPDQLFLRASGELAQALGLDRASESGGRRAARQEVVDRLIAARTEARDAAFAEQRALTRSMDGLMAQFATCIRCHNCQINCPICYCPECIFRTPTFDHDAQTYYNWATRKGSVRMLADTTLFHLTRLNHMVTSCIGCGMCTQVCPADIPVGTIFRAVGEKVQAIFDYHPGRSLDEPAPVQEFREDELTALGKRPH